MSASQSNLSNPNFDYDLVVATTQKSINTGLKIISTNLSHPKGLEGIAGGAHGIMQITEGAIGWETYKGRQHHSTLTQAV